MPIGKGTEDSAPTDPVGAEPAAPPAVVEAPKLARYLPCGPYPFVDAYSGTKFESGVPTPGERTPWVEKMLALGALIEVPGD